MTDEHPSEANEPELNETPETPNSIGDPIGDTTDGEAETLIGNDPATEDEDSEDPDSENSGADSDSRPHAKAKPPAKLERLQKILAAAGVASRRRAEELIEQGRVQVNGTTVTELGTKADLSRDHIRVDGKLLQGAERQRYFVLNKPKGFVTTVKDPEGRPTVMQFFEKMKERLYPVGRLDYMSEGLLLVTNDGDLANRLTKASSGVEKTYLVKVSGQPTEDELDTLRSGVTIERGKPGEGKVRTSPARIRQVRQGDNPWYEVIIIEGRNRELRKMFEEIGHFVEKIRRVGYGPLVLDQEPGNLRELEPAELEALRLAAEGKYRTPKSKDVRRQNALDAQRLPTVRPSGAPPAAKSGYKPNVSRKSARPGDYQPKRSFDKAPTTRETFGKDRPARPAPRLSADFEALPAARPYTKPASKPAWKQADRPERTSARPPARFDSGAKSFDRPARSDRPARPAAPRPFNPGPSDAGSFESRPPRTASTGPRSSGPRSGGTGRTGSDRPFGAKPAWNKSGPGDRSTFKRPTPPRREFHDFDDDTPVRPPNLHIEELPPERSSSSGPRADRTRPVRSGPARSGPARSGPSRTGADRTSSDRSGSARPSSPRPYSPRPDSTRPSFESKRPSAGRPASDRPSFDRGPSARPSYPRSSSGSSSGSSSDRPSPARPSFGRSGPPRPSTGRPSSARPSFDRPRPTSDRPASGRPNYDRPSSSRPSFESKRPSRPRTDASGPPRPPRSSEGLARPFTTSSGKPRPGGARPSSKPGGRTSSPRPGAPRGEKPRGERDTGWKPKTRYGGSKPAGRSKPGGAGKPSFKSKPASKRPGGKKR
jgi:23S rRNA pseudouridine2605 synthase